MFSGRGGRPRIPWTSSRKRKLVRLYLLTRLEQDEIQKVLVTSGFNPSSEDMMKKLRELLPRNYIRKGNLRASDEANMTLRFQRIRKCIEGRVRKRRGSSRGQRSRRISSGSNEGNSLQCASHWCFELPTPFRNYSDSRSASSRPHGLSTLRDSQLTNSSLLLLDGSVIARTDEKTTTALPVTRPSTPISISSLGTRLANKYSLSNLQHISAVLRSSSNSWRSSSMSATDSWKSRLPSRSHEASIWTAASQSEVNRYTVPKLLSDGEQSIWDDLVEDSQLDPIGTALRTRPIYQGISLKSRSCCDLAPANGDLDIICRQCGFSKPHSSARMYGEQAILSGQVTLENANEKDYFDNTLLHYVAASGHATLSTITSFLSLGVGPGSRNTSGETFLHLLPYSEFEGFEKYIDLLRFLAALRFPMGQRDYHGRTIAHILCADPGVKKLSIDNLAKICQVLAPDFHSLDNLGNSVRLYLSQWATEALAVENLERHQGLSSLLEQYNKPLRLQVDFRTVLSSMSCANKVQLQWVQSTHNITWVDVNGDTSLTAVLKDWSSEDDELKLRDLIKGLVQSGAEIHARDRNGNSALAIAAIRGFRSIVVLLLNAGAHYHARDYDGSGILEQATEALQIARNTKKDKLFAMIYCCITLLTDFGANDEPNEIDEWMSPPPLPRSDSRLWQ